MSVSSVEKYLDALIDEHYYIGMGIEFEAIYKSRFSDTKFFAKSGRDILMQIMRLPNAHFSKYVKIVCEKFRVYIHLD